MAWRDVFMKKPLFTGACTALVTPFLHGKVNYPMLEVLLRRQIEAGIPAVVVCGTTGEASTLTDAEKLEIIRRSKEFAGDKLCIIAGTGSNCTSHAVYLSQAAEDAGADALLVVSPYYNKGTNDGIYTHYLMISRSVSLPMILYNVPSRTGLDIPIGIYKKLAKLPNILGIKEASSDIGKIGKILSECPEDFYVWAGNDHMTVPAMSMGAKGVISVLSNLFPDKTHSMALAALNGDFDTASALQTELHGLTEALFTEVNPVPVKAALKLLGYDCGGCRLPLTEAKADTVAALKAAMP